MLNWLKFITGSVIFDRDAKQASQRKFWNVLFFLLMLLIMLSFFFAIGYNFAFKYHYKESPEYVKAYSYAMKNDDFNCKISNSELVCFEDNNEQDETTTKVGKLFLDTRTIRNDNPAEVADLDYDIVIDTRARDTFIEFTAYYVSKTDKEDVINHKEYLNKTEEERKNYKFSTIEYSQEDLDKTAYLALADTYFATTSDTKAQAEYEAMKVNPAKTDVDKINYFTKQALPGVINDYDSAPILMSYYSAEFLKTNSKKEFGYEYDHYILMLRDSMVTAYVTKHNVFVYFEGTYRKVASNYRFHSEKTLAYSQSKFNEHIKEFVMDVYDDIGSSQILNYAINVFRYMPFVIVIIAALALFMFLLTRMSNDDYADGKYIGCFKIACACSLGATLVTGIIGFILVFFFNQGVAFGISMSLLVSLLVLRVLLLTLISFFKKRKENKRAALNEDNSAEKMELL